MKGRVANIISGSPLASDLAFVMLEDAAVKAILQQGDYHVALNTKFQLTLKNVGEKQEQPEANASSKTEE
jgi:hypothetical protein